MFTIGENPYDLMMAFAFENGYVSNGHDKDLS